LSQTMEKKFIFLFFLLSGYIFSQQKSYTINWEGRQTFSTGNYKIDIPAFNKENLSYGFDEGLQFIDQWPTTTPVNESSLVLSNVSYTSITESELGDLDLEKIPNALTYSLTNSYSRNTQYAFLKVAPIIKESDGSYKKIVSFQVAYSQGVEARTSNLNRFQGSKAIANSVLSTGQWYRFYVDTTGVFQLNKNFIKQLGVDVDNIDPRTIKIYGNGGQMIPYSNAEAQTFDVVENAIKFVGEEDGVFNNGDYILFYAQGPKMYNAESNTNINCYTDKTYYFLNVGSGNGKRIQPFSQPSGPVDMVIDTFEDYQFHEIDTHNLAMLGRRWFGDRFDIQNQKTFEFNFPNIVASQPVRLKVYFASTSATQSTLNIGVNGSGVATLSISGAVHPSLAADVSYIGNVSVNASSVSVNLDFDNQGNPSGVGYLDYISVEATRSLVFENKQLQFKNSAVAMASGIGQYNVSNASQVSEIWDVTDKFNISNIENSEGSATFGFTAPLGTLRTYVALTPSDFYEPKMDSNTTVANQNIKGTVFLDGAGQFQDVDYIIVAPNMFLNQAERLAQ